MKGVSDMDAQNNKKIKGNKNDTKKPIQVLHISKKETNNRREEIFDNKQSQLNETKIEMKAIKPQIIEAPLDEEKENYSTNIKFENKSYQKLEKPITSQDENQDFIIERKVDEFDFDEDAFLAALNENEPIGATGETIRGKVIALESDGLYIDLSLIHISEPTRPY